MEYAFLIFVVSIMLMFAAIQANEIRYSQPINHIKEFTEWAICIILVCLITFNRDTVSFLSWIAYCFVFSIFLRGALYDYILNFLRGLPIDYVSPNANGNYTGNKESWYDDMLKKFSIRPNSIRIFFLVLSVIWLFSFRLF